MSGYTTRERMNDYVGSPVFASVTWQNTCSDGARHLLGRITHRCVRCGAAATVTYDSVRMRVPDPENQARIRAQAEAEGILFVNVSER